MTSKLGLSVITSPGTVTLAVQEWYRSLSKFN
jgi:hypothetical protein